MCHPIFLGNCVIISHVAQNKISPDILIFNELDFLKQVGKLANLGRIYGVIS